MPKTTTQNRSLNHGQPSELLISETGRARIQARLIGELRRGEPIMLLDGAAGWLALPMETAGELRWAKWAELLGADVPQAMLISGERAALLATGAATVANAAMPGSVLLPIDQGDKTLDVLAASLRILAGLSNNDSAVEMHIGLAAPAALDTITDLLKLGFLIPAAIVWQVPASLMPVLTDLAVLTTLPFSVRDLKTHPVVVRQTSSANVPLKLAKNARVTVYRTIGDGRDHVAIEITGRKPSASVPLVRLHAECFTGDLLGSLRCDCGDQLRGAIAQMAEAEGGILIYTAQEGRDIGLANKMRAYRLQDAGLDTIDANLALGFAADERVYNLVAAILHDMGHRQIRLLTNNPDKIAQLAAAGLDVVARVGHHFASNPHNEAYITTKQTRSGHLLD